MFACFFLYSTEQSLEQRIECLSRAVMCSKCCNLATTTSNEGEFLHELEERLEVSELIHCNPCMHLLKGC